MAKAILKFPLEIKDRQTIDMPVGSQVLSCQLQRDTLCLWALVSTEVQMIPWFVRIYGTGLHVPDIECADRCFVDTVQHGSLVWHVFAEEAL